MEMKKKLFVKNAAVLTTAGLVLRLFGIVFKIWLTRVVGQAGIGLYQIVFSFYVLASTFATTGIPTAVTRICGDEIAIGRKSGVRRVLVFSAVVIISLSALTFFALFFGAEVISKSILFDLRASFSIKVMGFSLPFTGICSCLRGYFIARRKATPPALSQIFEQIVRILFVFIAVKTLRTSRADIVCGVVMIADAVAEGVSCIFLALVCRADLRKLPNANKTPAALSLIISKMRNIAFPVVCGRYLNSFLRMFENITVPKKLVMNGNSSNSALSQFGMIKGSALPILFFPSTLLNAMSTLLLPELSIAMSKKKDFAVKSTVEEVVISTSAAAYIISALFFVCGKDLGVLFYNNRSVGMIIRALSPIVPLMYLDSICDGMLKGLNKQTFTFVIIVIDSALRLILIALFVPKFGLSGFIGIMYFSNAFTGGLNLRMLIKTSRARINFFKYVISPICCAVSVTFVVDIIVRAVIKENALVYIILVTLFSCAIYCLLISKISGLKLRRFLK